ncbi:GSCFA domain-containing protein [uncultured Parabacteroides sp.]|uniref:GSCFA domain-containing protein n=1 Tax=uncultured Parabacteroides sp. TaxID=512312 RepID=UPI0025861D6B|nr:GSCFA domain-containing protein [uncultured Parabacteroides sp.]
MELYTYIHIPKAPFRFSCTEQMLLLGSCFAENIGTRLAGNKFNVDINPFGTLYNPASIAAALRMLLHPQRFTAGDLFGHEGVYHSFAHHSRFSSTSETECLRNINDRLEGSANGFRKTAYLVVTLGTAYVYRLKSSGEVVANCHKLPEKIFDRSMLTVAEIVSEWKELLLSLWEQNPELKILFTVSPIRHWKDGAHGNQLSKATLLLAVDELQSAYPERIAYFPAYEIMMDELRDYRFYATDMLHPSELAIDYIWQRFTENFLSDETKGILKEWAEIQKAINHRPFQPESDAYKRFISQTLLKMERINEKFPSFDLTKEMEIIKSKLM